MAEHLQHFAGVNPGNPASEPTLRRFCMQFTEHIRRPLTDEQQKFFIRRQFEATSDLSTAVKRVVLLTLKSPRFLYRELEGGKARTV